MARIVTGGQNSRFLFGTHQYVFSFYALDCFLDLDSRAEKKDLLEAMQGHILQRGSVTGNYKREE